MSKNTEVGQVISKEDISRVRDLLSENLGEKIKISAKKGRKRIVVRQGVLLNTYPSIFTVMLESTSEFAEGMRTVSFSYSDILTKSISITVLDSKLEIV